jgi:hypothetical protein
MKAKSSKLYSIENPLQKLKVRNEVRDMPVWSYQKGYEQGKKDAEKKCPYATGIPPYFKKAKEKCIVVIGERDIIRKQTLEEVLKELKKTKKMIETYIKPLSEYERGRYEHAWNMILELEQKIKAME